MKFLIKHLFQACSQNCEKRLLASSCLSVRYSVHMEHPGCHWENFSWSLIFEGFSKICREPQVPLKSDKNNGYFTWRPIYVLKHISFGSSDNKKYCRRKLQRKSKHTFLCSVTVFRKSRLLWDNMEKYCRVGEDTDDSMAHAQIILGTKGNKYALNIQGYS